MLEQIGDLFELNVKLRCQKVKSESAEDDRGQNSVFLSFIRLQSSQHKQFAHKTTT
jgi:hypothetical protein